MTPLKYILLFSVFTVTLFSYNKDRLKQLSQQQTWLGLLHYDLAGRSSLVLNHSYFLHPQGMNNPYEELKSTITAYEQRNVKVICDFPARMFWLGSQLKWKKVQRYINQCEKMNSWDAIKDIESISVVFVSGFLGNPASAFGHSFLKLNKYGKTNTLENVTIGYGAKLPKQYTMLSYIYNGLTGGYKASYTDKYFYMDNMVYSNREYRDMWEYQLYLSEEKKKLLLYHLWELQNIEFQYYFLNKNCGYMLSNLLNVVSSKKIQDTALIWYAPIETFYAMEKLDDKELYIKEIIYHPSFQKKLYNYYKFLSKNKQQKISTIITSDMINENIISTLSVSEIDFLLDYYFYMLENIDNSTVDRETQLAVRKKYLLLLERLKHTSKKTKVTPQTVAPITLFNQTSRLGIEYRNITQQVSINYTPFTLDKLGYNTQAGDYFKLLDTSILFNTKTSTTNYHVDMISVRKLYRLNQLPHDKESIFSWKALLQIDNLANQKFQFRLNTGIGLTYALNDNLSAFGFLDFNYATLEAKSEVSPAVGIFFQDNFFRLEFGYENMSDVEFASFHQTLYLEGQYNIKRNQGIHFAMKKTPNNTSLEIGIKWYF